MEIAGTRAMAHQDVAKIVDRFDDDVNHGSFALDMAPDHPSGTAAADFIVSFPSVGVYDQVGLSGFVFKGDEGDAGSGAGPLATGDQAGYLYGDAGTGGFELVGGEAMAQVALFAEQGKGMPL